ncbi:MAG: cupin domain-containing protein [Janthinobacterium lividum]
MTINRASTAFVRAPSVEMSTWYKGILISSLVTEKDTCGAFEIVLSTQKQGTEPPPHVHDREDEFFYVLDGAIDVYVGHECLHATGGECAFLPRRKPHAFKIRTPEVRMLVMITPGGFLNATASMAMPAQELVIPPDDGLNYATMNLDETMRIFDRYGVRLLRPEEIARDIPAFPFD